jgi:hypothetical protein
VGFDALTFGRELSKKEGCLISAPGVRLRGAGGEPPQLRLRGLTCPAAPAGGRTPSATIYTNFSKVELKIYQHTSQQSLNHV